MSHTRYLDGSKGGEIMDIFNVRVTPNKTQIAKWFNNLLIFIAPVGIIYLSAVVGLLQLQDHVISLNDFVPSSFTWGAMTLYVVNVVLDYLRKVKSS